MTLSASSCSLTVCPRKEKVHLLHSHNFFASRAALSTSPTAESISLVVIPEMCFSITARSSFPRNSRAFSKRIRPRELVGDGHRPDGDAVWAVGDAGRVPESEFRLRRDDDDSAIAGAGDGGFNGVDLEAGREIEDAKLVSLDTARWR
jgi:hypothetical protein